IWPPALFFSNHARHLLVTAFIVFAGAVFSLLCYIAYFADELIRPGILPVGFRPVLCVGLPAMGGIAILFMLDRIDHLAKRVIAQKPWECWGEEQSEDKTALPH